MKVYKTRRLSSNKKASLSLSVNAIVVLVLGITMLGLGLAFTKGMFGKLKGKLEIPPPNIPATKDEPIVLPSDSVRVDKTGRDFAMSVNIYNDGGNQMLTPDLWCPLSAFAGGDATKINLIVTAPAYVEADEYAPFKIIIPADTLADGKTSVCAIYFCEGPTCDCSSGTCTDPIKGEVDQKQITITT